MAKDKINLSSDTPSIAPKTIDALVDSFKETQEIFNKGVQEVLEQITKIKFTDNKAVRKYLSELKEGQIDPSVALRISEKVFKKVFPFKELDQVIKIASKNVESGKSLDKVLNYMLAQIHKISNLPQYQKLDRAISTSTELGIKKVNEELNKSITKANELKERAKESKKQLIDLEISSSNIQKEMIRRGGGRGNILNPLVPYQATPNFTLPNYVGPTQSVYHSRKFEIVPYNQLNSFEMKRLESLLTPTAFSDFHAGAPTDINKATSMVFNGRRQSSFANPLNMQQWLIRQEKQNQDNTSKLIKELKGEFEGIVDSPGLRKWTKKFINSLITSLKNLPIFQTVAKAGTDLLRLFMLGIAGNKNMPDFIRKASLAGVALKVPESLVGLGGFAGDMLSTILSMWLFNKMGKGFGKFGFNIFKGKEVTQLSKMFGSTAKVGNSLKLAKGLSLGSLALLGLDLFADPLVEKNEANSGGPNWLKKINLAQYHGAKGAAGGALTGAMVGLVAGPEGAPIGAGLGALIGGVYGFWKGMSTDIEDIKESTKSLEMHRNGWRDFWYGGGKSSPSNTPNASNTPNNKYFKDYKILSPFGRRVHPITKQKSTHWGVDYDMPEGTPVHSAIGGTVTEVGYQYNPNTKTGWGKYVVVKSGDIEERYAHLSNQNVSKGQTIEEGQVIGESGSTGGVTGPHLHRERLVKGQYVNPESSDDGTNEAFNIINSGKRFRTTKGALNGYTGG